MRAAGELCQVIFTLNALTLLQAYTDPAYARILCQADLTLADGIGCMWLAWRWSGKKPERVAGIDLIGTLCRLCAAEGQSVYLLGGKAGVAQRAAEKLQVLYPGLLIAGFQTGYFSAAEESLVMEKVNRSGASLLLVGLGQPRQEQFIARQREALDVRLAMGVGGSFDVISGDLKRAPLWLRRAGGEWLFRVWQEPSRWWRILHLIRFIWLLLRPKPSLSR